MDAFDLKEMIYSGKKELKESIFQIKMIGIEPTPYEV